MNPFKSVRPARSVWAALLLVVSIAAFSAACSNPEQTKAEHLRQGEVFLKEKKFQEASIEFRNVIQIDNRSAQAYWGLAQAYEGLQRTSEAFDALQRAVALDPNNLDARIKLGNYYLIVYNAGKKSEFLTEAERLAGEILEKDKNHIEGHILLANVLSLRGDNKRALEELNLAISLNPQRLESYLSLARFHAQTGDAGKAEEAFKRALSMNDRASLAHVEYAKFLVQANRTGEAEAEFQKAVEVDPSNRDVRVVLASFYLVNKRLDKAEEAYKALAELDRDKPEGRAVLADFYATVGRYDEAFQIYQETVAKSPDYVRGRYRLGELMLQRGDLAGAQKQVEDILQKNANDMQARLLRSRIQLQTGKTKEAIEDLREVLKQEPQSDTGLYFMAEANFRAGQVEQARSFAADLERFHPDFLPAKLMQAQINLASGDAQSAQRQATELLERLTTATPNSRMSPQMLDELRAKSLTARGTASLQLKDTRAARADMEAARAAMPNSPTSYTNLAAVAVAENNMGEAAQLYERALSVDKASYDALSGIIRTYAGLRRLGDAHARIDEAIAAQPQNASLHFLKAQAYGTSETGASKTAEQVQEEAGRAEASLRRALELDPNYIAAYQALAALYFNLKQPERAIAEYRQITERQPDNVGAYTLMGMVEYSRNNYEAAEDYYRRALRIDPETTFAANNLAMLAADQGRGNLDEAVQIAQSIVRKYPDEPGYADTLGWVLYKKGLYPSAVEQLQKAVRLATAKGGDNALYRFHLGLALTGAGRKADARRELQTAQNLAQKEANQGRPFAQGDELRKALASL
ncbi:MAG TPA: tetratricopeptide repeat protein [Pyrinomonadaceae bacterium]|jgi:tetratricopeptide (TPR) repeat protein|nr:tetratricopeptide repeat protein [Pyrinomonadaceae bacterium]